MLIEPGEVHADTHVPVAADFRALFLVPSVVEELAAEFGHRHRRPHFAAASVEDPRLFAAFARLHGSLEAATTDLERQSRLIAGRAAAPRRLHGA